MKLVKKFQRSMFFAVICALLFSSLQVVQAEDIITITATGTITANGGEAIPLNMTFPPAGGKVTGSSNYEAAYSTDCTESDQIIFEGTFTGGDGGSVTGTASGTGTAYCKSGSSLTSEISGSWSGNFYANGTGNGVFDETATIGTRSASFQFPWQVTFSAAEFQAALPKQITSEYIHTTYGISVEDSGGGDGYAQTAWSDHELSLLNDVLKELPPAVLKNMALNSIIRSKVYLDEDGNQKPTVFGAYFPCGKLNGKDDCSGSSAAIRIFDKATRPFDFANDPAGDTEFKATILHEMIHAMQYRKDDSSEYTNPSTSPLVENFMDATRPNTAIETGIEGGINQNGWAWYTPGGWKLYGTPVNKPPTEYGKTKPTEDMAESAMMYVYDPQKLSQQRYNFIRDQMFGGVEYENGIQKKP